MSSFIIDTVSHTMRSSLIMERDRLLHDLELRYQHYMAELMQQKQRIAHSIVKQYQLQFDHIDLILASQISYDQPAVAMQTMPEVQEQKRQLRRTHTKKYRSSPPTKKRKLSIASYVDKKKSPTWVYCDGEIWEDGYHGGEIKRVEKRNGIFLSIPRRRLPKGHKYRDSHRERDLWMRRRGGGLGWTRCDGLNQPAVTDVAQHKEECPYCHKFRFARAIWVPDEGWNRHLNARHEFKCDGCAL